MALDGAFLRHTVKEIEQAALGARVDKIYQPNREEIVVSLRSREGAVRLLLSARANSARIHITEHVPENPKQPPMLCMLLRKKLGGAKLTGVYQTELERAAALQFEAYNELGDLVPCTLVTEIMGRHSNVILVDREGKIIDALKRVDEDMSSQRLVLPGLLYRSPPPQNKLCMLTCTVKDVLQALQSIVKEQPWSDAILKTLQGVSPIVCRELAYRACKGIDLLISQLEPCHWSALEQLLDTLFDTVKMSTGKPYMAVNLNGKPMDFSFMPIEQYDSAVHISQFDSFSKLLDFFYQERDQIERMRVRSQDLSKLLSNAAERLSRKINLQMAELAQCEERETLKMYGDLINANVYRLQKGDSHAEVENFYEEGCPVVRIPIDPLLTPSQNAQKYYKDYRKARTAQEKLTEQIHQAEQELAYIDSVSEALGRAENERDLSEIRQELAEQGYLRQQKTKGKQKNTAPAAPMKFITSDGFTVLVGRNNRQNDKLTLKDANNHDMWLHVKNIPGSHTIIVSDRREITEQAILEAAQIAAYYSRAKDSSQVPVDYTFVKHVSKPQGAKPGMVIYVKNKTVYVTPALPESNITSITGGNYE